MALSRYLALLLAVLPAAASAQIPVRAELESDPFQVLSLGTLAAEPFRARVVRADNGQPVAGAKVQVFVNRRFCIPLHPTCVPPSEAMYGRFDNGGQSWLMLTSDGNGRIVTPQFRAGTVAGDYDVAFMPDRGASSVGPVAPLVPGGTAFVQITQFNGTGSGGAAAVPTLSTWALLLLIGLMTLIGWRRG